MENADRCVCCGNIIPEGAMVCAECLNKCRDTYKDTQVEMVSENLAKAL